jgi:hypothetical protein
MFLTGRTANVLIYGEPRIGKSVYAIKTLKATYKTWRHPASLDPYLPWKGEDEWRNFIVYRPEQFVSLFALLLQFGIKVPMVVWDDAGLWLFALDWSDPRIKAVLKMLQVSGVATGALIFTTPAVSMILKKILNIEGIIVGKVVKASHDRDSRLCKLYKNALTPWGKRYVKQKIEDKFNVMLEQRDYDWYAPVRMSYLEDALKLMSRAYGVKVSTPEEAHQLMTMPPGAV